MLMITIPFEDLIIVTSPTMMALVITNEMGMCMVGDYGNGHGSGGYGNCHDRGDYNNHGTDDGIEILNMKISDPNSSSLTMRMI